jgi:hypothetical protein
MAGLEKSEFIWKIRDGPGIIGGGRRKPNDLPLVFILTRPGHESMIYRTIQFIESKIKRDHDTDMASHRTTA